MDESIARLKRAMPPEARAEFGDIEEYLLRRAMSQCGMLDLPAPDGDVERASGECVCEKCKQQYYAHPSDWRLIGYGNVPFATILCDGRRVKL